MPTAYLKKLAKLNKVSVNKLEKFWAQAKEIAKSEGNGKAWGLITSIFQNKLKKEGYKVKAFKEESREVDDKEFIFKRLSLSDCVKQIKDLFDDYFNLGKKDPEYYEKLHNTKVDESTASDLLPSDDFTVYIEYNDGSKWYSVNNPKLKDLKLNGIKNCIIEYPAYTAYFGKDCRIERFDDAEDAPYVVRCMYEPDTLDSTTKNKLDYIDQVKDCIKKIWARGTKNQQEFYAKDWTARYSRIVDDCINAFEEPKVCARMMYIKYHKENPSTRDLNKNHDTDFYTLLKEAKQYFEGLKKLEEDEELLNELNKQVTASTKVYSLKPFLYKKHTIYASNKEEAIKKIVAYTFGNRTVEDVKKYLKHYSPIEKEASNLSLYKKEIIRLLKADGQVRMLADKYKLNCLCKLCYEAKVSCYDAFRYISNNY